MERRLTRIGILGTVAYTVIIWFVVWGQIGHLSSMPLNEVGDFLAGVFGPLAVFWLILGFFQQGLELRLNTNALELQAKELRHSVEQQRELVDVAKKQFQADLQALSFERQRVDATFRPRLIVDVITKNSASPGEITFFVHLRNMGYTIVDATFGLDPVAIWCDPPSLKSWETGALFKLRITLPAQDISPRLLKIKYSEMSGTKGIRFFSVETEGAGIETRLVVNPLDIGEPDVSTVLAPVKVSVPYPGLADAG